MKSPGLLEGIVVAIGASIAGGILSALLPIVSSEYTVSGQSRLKRPV